MSNLEPIDVELRRAARERALELLYEAEAKGADVDDVVGELPLSPDPLALELVRGVATHRTQIDELLTRRVAPRWSLNRLAAVDRAVLRLATYELIGAAERSQAVIINEAVVLARRFGTDDSPRFVNGVLSAAAAEVRPKAEAEPVVETAPEPLPTDADAAAEAEASPPEPERQVDAVIVDLDGVIRHWDNDALPAADRALGLPTGTVSRAAFEPKRLDRAMRGELTADEWYAEVGEAVAAAHDVKAAAVAEAFAEIGWRIDESVLDLLDQVRDRGVPVVLLSNASTRLVGDLLVSGITDRFDALLSSAELRAVKPEPAAFAAAVTAAGVPAGRCLLIDDTSANISGARAAGLRTFAFEDVEGLEAELKALGLLPASHLGPV